MYISVLPHYSHDVCTKLEDMTMQPFVKFYPNMSAVVHSVKILMLRIHRLYGIYNTPRVIGLYIKSVKIIMNEVYRM